MLRFNKGISFPSSHLGSEIYIYVDMETPDYLFISPIKGDTDMGFSGRELIFVALYYAMLAF